MPILVNMESYLTSIKEKSSSPQYQRDFADASLREMHKRFPKCGAEVSAYATANILHPYFRGNLLKNYSTWNDQLQKFIFENEPEVEEIIQDLNTRPVITAPDVVEDEFWASADLMNKRWQDTQTENQSQTSDSEVPNSPLKAELDIYMKLPLPASSKLDILAWWNGQKVNFPKNISDCKHFQS
jgi:hypothetical protein